MHVDTLAIVGVGLIGASIGQSAKSRGIARQVIGIGRNEQSLALARDQGAIDRFTIDLAEGVKEADLVVFCTPVDMIAHQVRLAALSCRPGTLLTDAGSTKANIVRDVEGKLPAGIHFVGGHPLAGSEKRGPAAAVPDLFAGKVTIVTRTRHTDPDAFAKVSAFWTALGSDVRVLDPETHDMALAFTSHLPHLAASALAGLVPEPWRIFTASGFRDTTRIAAGDPGLWSAIFRENALAMSDALQKLARQIDRYREAILDEDNHQLIDLLTQAKRVRDALGS